MIKKIISKVLWIAASVLFAIVLTVAAVGVCAVRLLESDRLTGIVCRLAEDKLNASVSIDRIDLSLRPSLPLLKVDVSSLEVVSHSLDSLPDSVRRGLPAYSDTLITIGRLRGGIDLARLVFANEISLHSLEIERPQVNIVITPEAANFDIYTAQPDTAQTASAMPAISIDHFAFVDPKAIRFYNAIDSTEANVLLLSTANLDGSASPEYALKIVGELRGPVARSLLNLEGFDFGVNGKVRWNPAQPELLSVETLRLNGAFIDATVDARMSFSDNMTVEAGSVKIERLDITEALVALDGETLRRLRLEAPFFTTDASLRLGAVLRRPFCFETDTIPYADLRAEVGECTLRYGRARFHNLSLDATVRLAGPDIDSVAVMIDRLTVAGPATSLVIDGQIGKLRSDPTFRMAVKGYCDFRNLPPQAADAVRGYLAGKLKADITVNGASSMFSPGRFHELNAVGSLTGNNIYYLSNDTAQMVEIPSMRMTFDSHRTIRLPEGGTKALLSAKIEVDSADVLSGGVSIKAGGLTLAAAALNTSYYADTTMVLPVGGGITLRNFSVRSITDSAGMNLRNLEGRVLLHRYKDDKHTPRIALEGKAGRIAAGSPTTVFLLSDAHINASTHQIPERAAMRRAVNAAADSIRQRHPHLSPDSVMRLAVEKRLHRPHRRRVKVVDEGYDEMIDWGISHSFRRFLLDWELEGNISTDRARLFTPYFPLRNSIRRLDIRFNTDSVELRGVEYRAGKTDLALDGLVSNIRGALTARGSKSILKANMSIKSDTIDVNEIAGGVFAGSAYAEKRRSGRTRTDFGIDSTTDSELESTLEALVGEKTDSVGPLLLPSNIDARIDINASNIIYSDLHMRQLGGKILLYDGALNIDNLTAESDAGSLDISALYAAPNKNDMKFGFGMMLDNFRIEKFLNLVPAIDSIMPIMRDFSGVIDANLAATVDIDSAMNFVLPTLDAAVKLTGDSLAFINPDTYRTLGKWLRFRDRSDNKIKHMSVEMLVRDNKLEIFPFTFDIDRYRLGVTGYNDLALNFNYHIAVLKSPVPFKFGINISGNPDKYKVRFGGAKFNEKLVTEAPAVVDTARVNLVRQIQNVFRRGVRNSNFASLKTMERPDFSALRETEVELTPADSIALIEQGYIEQPVDSAAAAALTDKKKKRKK